jgi:hypothetical protein
MMYTEEDNVILDLFLVVIIMCGVAACVWMHS